MPHLGLADGNSASRPPSERVPVPSILLGSRPSIVDLRRSLDLFGVNGLCAVLAGLRANDDKLRAAIRAWRGGGLLNRRQAFRCAVFQVCGPEAAWPLVVRNFAEGVDAGIFAVVDLPPPSVDALVEHCIRVAGHTGRGDLELGDHYRAEFSARFGSARFASFSDDFDPLLNSFGPRTPRARAVFQGIYQLPVFQAGYDTDTPPGFRHLCDTLAGADGTNLIASPRLHALRLILDGRPITASSSADPRYASLVAEVRQRTAVLDAHDRWELEHAQAWRLAVERKVEGPSPEVTRAVRAELWNVVTTAPAPPSGGPAPGARAMPTRAVRTSRAARSRAAAAQPAYTADQDRSVGRFPARSLPPLETTAMAPSIAWVERGDRLADVLIANLRPGLRFVDHADYKLIGAGGTAHYTGKQCPISVTPQLAAGCVDQGLDLQLDGRLVCTKNGNSYDLPRAKFDRRASELMLFQTILRETSATDDLPEGWILYLSAFHGAEPTAFHTFRHPFWIARTPPGSLEVDAAQMEADNAWLNGSIGADGSLLHHMARKGGQLARVARSVSSGALKLRACFVRSDSADQVTALEGAIAPTSRVAYAMGGVDPLGRAGKTLVAAAGAIAWRWSPSPDTIYLNTTPIPGGDHRSLDLLSEVLAHEGRHAADRAEGGVWGLYATEFRACWLGGEGERLPTSFDAAMTGTGPKAPRARAIFDRLYRSAAYAFVKSAYDANETGFRERVDSYLFPDGINLTLSAELTALRTTLETAVPGHVDLNGAALAARLAACAQADAQQVANNRAWRDLVEAKFANAKERDQIKDVLKIPR
jgi:hypothetical protein